MNTKVTAPITQKLILRCKAFNKSVAPEEYRDSVNELLNITDKVIEEYKRQIANYEEQIATYQKLSEKNKYEN